MDAKTYGKKVQECWAFRRTPFTQLVKCRLLRKERIAAMRRRIFDGNDSSGRQMNKVRNTIFYFALLVLLFWWGVPIFLAAKGIELLDKRLVESYKIAGIFVVPFAILLTLVKTLKRTDDASDEGRKAGLTIGAALFFMVAGIFTLLASTVCTNNHFEPLFVNGQSGIYLRDYGCGATDSDPPSLSVVRVDTVYRHFLRIYNVDTTHLDKSHWLRCR
ncbi:hypothetical protein [Flaviaesturariibacter terrae]